jgi:hypothetical protein
MKLNLICLLITITTVFASGGFDHGTSTGRGKFQFDITLNPFNYFKFGQDFIVGSYGFTNQLDIHGYISRDYNHEYTVYAGVFFQFLSSKKLDLATALGFRKNLKMNWTHVFMPQLLYTYNLSEKVYVGGSLVNVMDLDSKNNFGTTIDFGIFKKIRYKSNLINELSFGISAFHPVTWKPKKFFLPTYSINIIFN